MVTLWFSIQRDGQEVGRFTDVVGWSQNPVNAEAPPHAKR